ncbi:MAG: fused MFS/spermidine synthase [Myxococcota bacterium]
MAPRISTPVRLGLLYLALVLSGAAALAYQTAWGRMLQRIFGVSDLAVATVLATFFAGLGIGSWLGGRWTQKLARPVRVYALIEAAIGAYALLSLPWIPQVHLIYGVLGRGASFELLSAIRCSIAMLLLLPPTIMMGATLPILIGFISRHERDWSAPSTLLYAVNTLGAVLGAGLTGFYLLPVHGNQFTILTAASLSLAAGAAVLLGWQSAPTEEPASVEEPRAKGVSTREAIPSPEANAPAVASPAPEKPASIDDVARVQVAITLATISGFAALASEVLWTRVLRTILGGTTIAFSAMLVNYLTGIALGSLLAKRWARRYRPQRLFACTQLALAILTLCSLLLTPQMVRWIPLLRGDLQLTPHEPWIILTVSAALLLPIALALGTSVPLAWSIAQRDPTQAPTQAGSILAANTIGGLLGSIVAGFVLVPTSGIETAIHTIASIHCVCAAFAWASEQRDSRPRTSRRRALPAVFLLLFAAVLPIFGPPLHLPYLLDARHQAQAALIRGPGAEWEAPLKFIEEGRNTTVTLTFRDGSLRLYNDGRPESGFGQAEPGFGSELILLGGLPSLFAERTERAMVVGLGAGHTATMLLRGPWSQVDVVELEEAVVRAARVLHEARDKPFPLDDARTRLIVDDARAQLALAEEDSLDAVVSQPSHPWLAGSSALYTLEFFQEVDRALRPGGVCSLWLNMFRIDLAHARSVLATLNAVFSSVQAFIIDDSSLIMLAGNGSLQWDEGVESRLALQPLSDLLAAANIRSTETLASFLELDAEATRAWTRDTETIHDDRPTLEFELARLDPEDAIDGPALERAVQHLPWVARGIFAHLSESSRAEAVLERIERVQYRRSALNRLEASLGGLDLSRPKHALLAGRIHEARGNLRAAAETYADSSDPEAIYRLDLLRHDEGLHRVLLTHALQRHASSLDHQPLLSSAFATQSRSMMRNVIQLVPLAEHADQPLLPLGAAFARGGCTSLLAAPELEAQASEALSVAALAMRCAFEHRQVGQAARMERHYARLLRSRAVREANRGKAAQAAGNGGLAMVHFRRALKSNPGHGASAATYATQLDRLNRRAEAEAVLRRAARETKGLPASTAVIRNAAATLGIDLE